MRHVGVAPWLCGGAPASQSSSHEASARPWSVCRPPQRPPTSVSVLIDVFGSSTRAGWLGGPRHSRGRTQIVYRRGPKLVVVGAPYPGSRSHVVAQRAPGFGVGRQFLFRAHPASGAPQRFVLHGACLNVPSIRIRMTRHTPRSLCCDMGGAPGGASITGNVSERPTLGCRGGQ